MWPMWTKEVQSLLHNLTHDKATGSLVQPFEYTANPLYWILQNNKKTLKKHCGYTQFYQALQKQIQCFLALIDVHV